MKKNIRRTLSFVLSLLTLFSVMSISFAASAVGKVNNLQFTARTENSITLKWSAVSGAAGYQIYSYNYTAKKWQTIKKTTGTSYVHRDLIPGKLYGYGVRALEKKGNRYVAGDASNIIQVLTLPEGLKNLKTSNIKSDSLTLTWSKAAGATGYCVYQYDSAAKKYNRIKVTSDTSFKVTGLKGSTSYRFGVRAYTKNGSVVYGTPAYVTAKTSAVSKYDIKNFRLENVGDNSFRLSWDKLNANITGYQLCVYEASSKAWKRVKVTSENYADFTKIKPTSTYTFTVGAYRKNADGTYSFGPLADSIKAFAKPDAPTGLKGAQNSDDGISLAWDKVAGADGYRIYIYDSVNAKWVYKGATAKNSYNDNTVSKTSAYTYKVCACKISNGRTFEGNFCQSVTVAYESHKNSDSIYSEEMEKSGVLGYLYDPKGKYFYTSADPWQRNFGFNSLYDSAAPFTLINYETVRLRFEYGDKDWMLQVWKGQYGLVFYGGEAGIYTKPKDREVMHYDCASDDEMLKMCMVFNEKRLGKWTARFTRPYGDYWWCTGFLPGNKLGQFDTLRLDMRVTAKDYEMLAGLKGALEQNGISYETKGLDVYFSF